MRVLVIGGTAFIGPPTVRRLLAAGCEVVLFHRGNRKATANESLVTLAVHMDVDVGLEADETGQLQPKIDFAQHVDVAETPRGPVNEPVLEGLIGGIIGQLPTLLAQGVGGDAADRRGRVDGRRYRLY